MPQRTPGNDARVARHLRDPNSLLRGKLKAVKILGLRVRAMDVDVEVVTDNTGLTGDALRTPVKDHARGLHPFLFGEYFSACIFLTLANCSHRTVATVETTSSGAID